MCEILYLKNILCPWSLSEDTRTIFWQGFLFKVIMYSVYIHTFPNGKKYVGVTSWKPELRWGANGCNYKNSYMVNAIKKYGWKNIKHEIVAEGLTADEASDMEKTLIQKYNSANREYGYNISLGGVNSRMCSDETKEKIRKANIGKVMSEESKRKISKFQIGRKRSELTKRNMSIAQKKSFANGNNAIHSPEVRARVAEKLRGRKLPDYIAQKASEAKYHPVENMQTGVIYPSIKAACEDSGLNRSTIIRHCNGMLKNKKWRYSDEYKTNRNDL